LEAGIAEKKLILRNAPFFLPFTTVCEPGKEKNFDIINVVTI
jgi:hypothetical protein